MRLSTILTITIALLFALLGCNRQQSAQQVAQPSVSTSSSLTASTAAISANLTQAASPLATAAPTPILQVPVVSEWLTYTHESGVSVEYPAQWQVQPNPPAGTVLFGIQLDEAYIPSHRVILDVFDRPLKDRAITDPYTWQPNSGGYEVQWAKPISVENASGLEFVWSSYPDQTGQISPSFLQANYYSDEYELDIRLSTSIEGDSLELIETIGITDTIASRFAVFEHMVNSVKVNPSAQPSAPISPLATPAGTVSPMETQIVPPPITLPFLYTCPLTTSPSLPSHLQGRLSIELSDRDGWCKAALFDNWYSLLYPENWVLRFVGVEGLNLLFNTPQGEEVFVQLVRFELPLEQADQATYSYEKLSPEPLVGADETTVSRAIQTIGESQVLTLLTRKGEVSINRYFLLLGDGHLLMFEVKVPTVEFNNDETTELLANVEEMVASLRTFR